MRPVAKAPLEPAQRSVCGCGVSSRPPDWTVSAVCEIPEPTEKDKTAGYDCARLYPPLALLKFPEKLLTTHTQRELCFTEFRFECSKRRLTRPSCPACQPVTVPRLRSASKDERLCIKLKPNLTVHSSAKLRSIAQAIESSF